MQDGKASQTAQYVAFCRALETQEQPARRLFDDPYAFAMLSDPYRIFTRPAHLPILGKPVYAILNPYRFLLLNDVSTAEIARSYCHPPGRREPGDRTYRVATAAHVET